MQSFLSKKVEISWHSAATRWLTLALVVAMVAPGSLYFLTRRAASAPTDVVQRSEQASTNSAERLVVLPSPDPQVPAALPIVAEPSTTPTVSPTAMPSASATATVASRDGIVTHAVQSGETVGFLAEKYRVSEDTIRWANGLDGSPLQSDQRLLIPPVSGVLYTVRSGDKLADIAAMYQVDEQTIIGSNKLTSPDALEGGIRLVIPGARPVEMPRGATAARGDRQAQTATNEAGATSYEVASGDTLSGIAAKFNVTVSTIANANSIPDPNHLTAGQRLVIPALLGVLHTVQEGDSVAWIAARYGVAVEEIAAANKLGSVDLIKPGDRILIPSPASSPGGGATPTPSPTPKAAPTSYTVQPGDTLLAIAYQLGIAADQIAQANGLTEPFALREGQVLRVPGAGGQQNGTGETAAAPAKTAKYMVVAGDTVFGLSVSIKVPADIIISLNGLQSPYNLQVGQELVIPAVSGDDLAAGIGGAQPVPAPADPPAPTPTPTVVVEASPTPPPTAVPTARPTNVPTARPTNVPTARPTSVPTAPPTATTAPKRTPTPVPTAPMPSPAPSGSLGARIVELAMQYRGYRYTWGGTSPATGFDCSGFVYFIYKQAGRPIPRDLFGQLNAGPRVNRDQLQPGDIVYFQNTYTTGLSHDGIYIGGGRFISANSENVGVIITGLSDSYWSSKWYAANRP
ncbi:MAG: LysM peptidoglycan-binding domain-containing protein [Chloroflexota bacterium]|nr:MAG: LysM peptidoglycan-binding domain-containing protein [Chloroflexota bacterium]